MFRWLTAAALGVVILAAAPTVNAQDGAVTQPDAALRLETLLRMQRDRGESVRILGGVAELTVGAAFGGVGAYALAAATVDAARALGIAVLATGVLLAAFGGVILVVDTTPEDRWQRWQAVRARGVSPYDVAEFVGELRAEARQSQLERAVAIASGIALALAGAAATSLGVTLMDEGLRLSFEVAGIGVGVAGLALSLLALAIEPDNVRELRAYERGAAPSPAAPRPTVAPLVAPGTAGLVVAGSF